MTRLLPWLLLGSGCIFITQADIDARRAGMNDSLPSDTTGYDDDDDDDAIVPGDWLAVSVGDLVSCAIDRGYDLHCWDQYGEVDTWLPAMPDDVDDPDFVGLSMGTSIGCAWDASGETRCFGRHAGTDNNPERSVDATPGTFEVVRCGNRSCCGIANGDVSCWDTDPLELFQLEAHPDGVVDVAGWGDGWCVLDATTSDVDCFTTSSGSLDNDPDWTAGPIEELHTNRYGMVCAVSEDAAGCWGPTLGGATALQMLDVSPTQLDALVSKQGYANAQTPNLCGLAAGELLCYAPASQSPYAPTIPSGAWTQLSAAEGAGCVIDNADRMACFGEAGQLPTNAP